MTYYHFKFDATLPYELDEVLKFIDYLSNFKSLVHSKKRLLTFKIEEDIFDDLLRYVKEKMSQDFEVEVRDANSMEYKNIQYSRKDENHFTYFLLPLFKPSYLFDIFNR